MSKDILSDHESIRLLFKDSGYYSTPRGLRERLGLKAVEVAVLMDLVNTNTFRKRVDGYFSYSAEAMEKEHGLDRNGQKRVLDVLRERGFIDTKKRGFTGRRTIFVDMVKLLPELIANAKDREIKYPENGIFEEAEEVKYHENMIFDPPKYPEKMRNSIKNNIKKNELPEERGNGRRSAPTSPVPSGNGLFPSIEEQHPKLLVEWARRLHRIILDKHKIRATLNTRRWVEDFRALLNKCEGDEARVERVLSWYEKNPSFVVESARGFARHFFTYIETGYSRANKSSPAKNNPAPEIIDPDAKEVLDELLPHFDWPKGSAAQLPAVVSRSLAAHKIFRKKFIDLKKELRNLSHVERLRDGMYGFMEYAQPAVVRQTSADFVVAWFARVNDNVKNWSGWSGRMDQYVFAEDHDDFDKMGREQAARYGDIKMWDKLKGRLSE